MELFRSNNIAELCRKYEVSGANFYKRNKFIESSKKGFYELDRSGDNEYEKENERLKRLIGDPALVIDELKKITEGEDNGNNKYL